MQVLNINGTSDSTCKCGSWLTHWYKFSGQTVPNRCPVEGCTNRGNPIGAHVQKPGDTSWYIIPICSLHNAQRSSALEVADATKLVSANKSQTCD